MRKWNSPALLRAYAPPHTAWAIAPVEGFGNPKALGCGLLIMGIWRRSPPPKRSFGTPFSLIDSFEEGEAIAEPPFDSNYPPKNGTADERT